MMKSPLRTSVARTSVLFVAVCVTWSAIPAAAAQSEPGRFEVRPAAIAIGRRTDRARVQRLDSLYSGDSLIDQSYVYVPPQCVGTHRCPLGVLLHGSDLTGLDMIQNPNGVFRIFADSVGIIYLAPTTHSADHGWGNPLDPQNVDVPRIAAAMRTVLVHYAIDPTRMILLGESAGAGSALDWGVINGDLFSRVMLFAAWMPFAGEHEFDAVTRHGKPAMFFGTNTQEGDALQLSTFVPWLQQRGYHATYRPDTGGHATTLERGQHAFTWLTHTDGWH